MIPWYPLFVLACFLFVYLFICLLVCFLGQSTCTFALTTASRSIYLTGGLVGATVGVTVGPTSSYIGIRPLRLAEGISTWPKSSWNWTHHKPTWPMLNISPLSAGIVRVTVTSFRRLPRGNFCVLKAINNHRSACQLVVWTELAVCVVCMLFGCPI